MLKATPFQCYKQKNKEIVGEIYYPKGKGPFPLVIYSHGYGYNSNIISVKPLIHHGIAFCHFDFRGGSPFSKSGGSSLEMSVLTEADDLSAVLNALQKDPKIDNNHIFLCGGSQGGYVSTVVATKRPDEIAGLFLISPAFVITDIQQLYLNGHDIKESYQFGNMSISQKYIDDAARYPIYPNMRKYPGLVKIYHGGNDSLVPMKYAEKALAFFPNATLTKFADGGHILYSYQRKIEHEIIQEILKRTAKS